MVRHFLRSNPAVRGQGCPYPEYTPEFERMITLVQRMRDPLGTSDEGLIGLTRPREQRGY